MNVPNTSFTTRYIRKTRFVMLLQKEVLLQIQIYHTIIKYKLLDIFSHICHMHWHICHTMISVSINHLGTNRCPVNYGSNPIRYQHFLQCVDIFAVVNMEGTLGRSSSSALCLSQLNIEYPSLQSDRTWRHNQKGCVDISILGELC